MTRLTQRWQSLTILATVFLAFLAFGTSSASAQTSNSGTVTGSVSDSSGALIPGASIVLKDPSTKTTRTTVTNQGGQFVLSDVQPGTYNITAAKAGFSTDNIAGLIVSVGTQTTANFKMAVGAESTTIEVQASNADIQTLSATTGTTVDQSMVESLPAIGRDVATFATMQPGVAPGGYTAGTTQDQTTFMLDGGTNTADMDGTQGVYTSNNTGSTTGGFLGAGAGGVVPMPQDSIEEFKVNTTGQTADFNNSTGSQSQVVTKRGRDAVHATIYEYYLDNNFDGNSWQNNFPTSYTPKPSYHYSRFGAAAGGPILPNKFGGKTYLFANFEGFRWPNAATYERAVPSYNFLQLGQLSYGGTPIAPAATYSAAQLQAADPLHVGQGTGAGYASNPTLKNYYNTQLPVAPPSNSGSTGNNGATYGGIFDQSCGALSGSICDSQNVIGFRANIAIPQTSNFLATRLDHDFGPKWHFMASYRYYRLNNLTSNQVDIGGVLPGDKIGYPVAVTPRPQTPWFLVIGVTTNISSSLTNDFHYNYLRNNWVWKGAGAPPQISGAGGVIEPLGESTTNVLAPFNVNAQNIRTRIWDGKDNSFRDDLSKLKGNHFIQVGASYQHNFNYHQRTDNGASINYTPTYQLGDTSGGGNIAYNGLGAITATGVTAANIQRQLDTYFGFVTDTQVANTYTNNNGTLNLNPPATPIGAHTTIPYYNVYATDTWHALPSLTLNFGLSYALEMPPTERDGNQVMFTDISGNALPVDQYLAARKAAAIQGQVYNPEIGFALIKNVNGGRKYPYDPYKTAFSPRISAAWNPKFKNAGLNKIFGEGATVIRGGYGRIYSRINGDAQVLNPLLSPGLILATQCKYAQAGGCNQSNYTDSTAYRFGTGLQGLNGITPATAAAPPPSILAQPYHPGFDGPGVALASPLDPSLRPGAADTFNLSIQRQINRKMLIEVGYIGRLVHHEYIMENPNSIPYMLSQGGQTFQSAYLAIETALGCTTSASLCATSALPTNATIAPQPFFETALGGASSTYCTTNAKGVTTAYGSCTAAVIAKQTSNLRTQKVFALWQALDNNALGANGAGFNFARSLMGTTTSNATYGGAGQVVTGLSMGTANGYSNYNGGYVSFKATNWHGVTLQENLTWSKAMGLGAYNQSTSSIAAEDNFNLREQYGLQGFDQKLIFNTFIVYNTPWFKDQHGIVGRALGGWTLSPVVTAGTGQPLECVGFNNGQHFGGEDGANFTDGENCIFNTKYTGGSHTHRAIAGGADPLGDGNIGTNNKATGLGINSPAAQVNMFNNPVAVWDTVRPAILGLDTNDGGAGPIRGLGYLNLDLSVKKRLVVFEKFSLEATGIFLNFMNHLDFANPSLSLQSPTSWGTTKTQGNSPRQIEMGIRASF
jgi:hypothetical protein